MCKLEKNIRTSENWLTKVLSFLIINIVNMNTTTQMQQAANQMAGMPG